MPFWVRIFLATAMLGPLPPAAFGALPRPGAMDHEDAGAGTENREAGGGCRAGPSFVMGEYSGEVGRPLHYPFSHLFNFWHKLEATSWKPPHSCPQYFDAPSIAACLGSGSEGICSSSQAAHWEAAVLPVYACPCNFHGGFCRVCFLELTVRRAWNFLHKV